MTHKLIKFFKENKWGALSGAIVGVGAAIFYKLSGGDFVFAMANLQGRAGLPEMTLIDLAYWVTVFSWIIIGAIFGIIIDKYLGFKFSPKTKKILLIIGGLLLIYLLFFDIGMGRGVKTPPVSGAVTLFTSGAFLTFLSFVLFSLFGAIKGIFAPSPSIPIWLFFVGGFLILLLLKRRQPEQPIIIQR